jgi:hypothetical protein
MMKVESFGQLQTGQEAHVYTIENDVLQVQISNYGATIVAVYDKVLQRHLALGYDSVQEYKTKHGQLGATVGRVANRIANAAYTWNGTVHQLTANNGPNLLHSGKGNIGHRLWDVVEENCSDTVVHLSHSITSEEDGFLGDLYVEAVFRLVEQTLVVTYVYTTSEDSFVNLTNHVYFNLHGEGNLSNHVLELGSHQYMPFGDHQIPQLEPASVDGTPFDFRKGMDLQKALEYYADDLSQYKGYDHDFLTAPVEGCSTADSVVPFAVLQGKDVTAVFHTDAPHFQVYTGNWLNEDGRDRHYGCHTGIAIEPQFMPNDINMNGESKTKADTVYERTIAYSFYHR